MIQLLLKLSALSFVVGLGAGDVAIVQHHAVAHGIALAAGLDLLMFIVVAIMLALFEGGPDVPGPASDR